MESGKTIFEVEFGNEKVISHMIGLLPITNDWILYFGDGVKAVVKEIIYNASEHTLYVYMKPQEDD